MPTTFTHIDDEFDRTVDPGWGNGWAVVRSVRAGNPDDFTSVDGDEGLMSFPGGAGAANVVMAQSGAADNLDVTVQLTLNGEVVAGAVNTTIQCRIQDIEVELSQSHYGFTLITNSANNYNIQIRRMEDGVQTNLVVENVAISTITGLPVWVRCQADGIDLRMKVWEVGDPEPSTWNLETTDSTFSGSGGHSNNIAIAYFQGSNAISSSYTVAYDNFLLRGDTPPLEVKTASTSIDLELDVATDAEKHVATFGSLDLEVDVDGVAAKNLTSSTELSLELSIDEVDAVKDGLADTSLPLSLDITGTDTKDALSSTDFDVDLDVSPTGEKSVSSAASLNIDLDADFAAAKSISASTELDITIDLDTTAEKSGETTSAFSIDLDITSDAEKIEDGVATTTISLEFGITGTVSKSTSSAASMGVDAEIAGISEKSAFSASEIGFEVDLSGLAAKSAAAASNFEILAEIAGSAAKTVASATELALEFDISGIAITSTLRAIRIDIVDFARNVLAVATSGKLNRPLPESMAITFRNSEGLGVASTETASGMVQVTTDIGFRTVDTTVGVKEVVSNLNFPTKTTTIGTRPRILTLGI